MHIPCINTLRQKQNECHFADDIFKCIFFNENDWISLRFHLSLFLRVHLTIFQHWFRYNGLAPWGDKPLSEPMMVSLPTHICVTWPQWVKECHISTNMPLCQYRHLYCEENMYARLLYVHNGNFCGNGVFALKWPSKLSMSQFMYTKVYTMYFCS